MTGKARNGKQVNSLGALPFLLPVLLLTLFAVAMRAGQSPAGDEAGAPISDRGTLMLVRAWDPDTGELIGWLPIHQAAMDLQLVSELASPPHFELNQAVTIAWPPPHHSPPKAGQLLISPPVRIFEGHGYVPVEKDANVVRIGKLHFLVRKIVLGDADWRHASQAKADSKTGKGKKAKQEGGLLASRP